VRRRVVGWIIVGSLVVTAGCAPGSDATDHTGPALELAPSQRSAPTAVPPSTPALCDPADVATESVTPASGADQPDAPDVVVVVRNDGPSECEVSLGADFARPYDVEPDVWLAPGDTAQLWGTALDHDCLDGGAGGWDLAVNGAERHVDLGPGSPCGLVPSAFFPD
jgi:hypothetical protein